jgi:hypothetical protein
MRVAIVLCHLLRRCRCRSRAARAAGSNTFAPASALRFRSCLLGRRWGMLVVVICYARRPRRGRHPPFLAGLLVVRAWPRGELRRCLLLRKPLHVLLIRDWLLDVEAVVKGERRRRLLKPARRRRPCTAYSLATGGTLMVTAAGDCSGEMDSNSRWLLGTAWNSSSVNSVSCAPLTSSRAPAAAAWHLMIDARDRREQPWRSGVRFRATAEITTAFARKASWPCYMMAWMGTIETSPIRAGRNNRSSITRSIRLINSSARFNFIASQASILARFFNEPARINS